MPRLACMLVKLTNKIKDLNEIKRINNVNVIKEILINKATSNDKKDYLRTALKNKFESDGMYIWDCDYDDVYAYFTAETYRDNYKEGSFRLTCSFDSSGVNVTLGDEVEEVAKESTYTLLSNTSDNASTLPIVSKSVKDDSIPFVKQFTDDEMIAVEVVYAFPGESDSDGEGMTEETIRKMVGSCNKAIDDGRLSCGLHHETNLDSIEFLKVWVNECPCYIGDTFVPEGAALAKTKFNDTELWEQRKSGELGGLSIGAMCTDKVPNEDET